MIDKLSSELELLKDEIQSISKNSSDEKLDLRKLSNRIEKLRSTSLSNVLEDNMKYLSNPFSNSLLSAHPDLNFEDIKLSYLLFNKLSTKEMASQLNISLRGVETRRYRLRKKLRLKRSQSLTEYIDHLKSI